MRSNKIIVRSMKICFTSSKIGVRSTKINVRSIRFVPEAAKSALGGARGGCIGDLRQHKKAKSEKYSKTYGKLKKSVVWMGLDGVGPAEAAEPS